MPAIGEWRTACKDEQSCDEIFDLIAGVYLNFYIVLSPSIFSVNFTL